jgi:hypothetical protein
MNFCIVAIIYPATEEMDRYLLQSILNDWWSTITDVASFTESNLSQLFETIIEHPLKLV